MKILIVDGQGGGVGSALIQGIAPNVNPENLIACGINSRATQAMQRAGAKNVATGENAVIYNAKKADIIVGSTGIINPNSMLGELSPKMARAIGESDALKILIPFDKCRLKIMGLREATLAEKVNEAIKTVLDLINS